MAVSKEQIEQMARNAQGIPANPAVQAKIASETLQLEQPIVPSGMDVPSPAEQGLNEEPSAVDFFGGLAADMDSETSSMEPAPQQQQLHAPQSVVEELLYEAPVHQRPPGEHPESLLPQVGPEHVPLEAAIERPLVEEEIRMTAEQWAVSQVPATPPPIETPIQEQQPVDFAKLETDAIDRLTTTEYVLTDEDKNLLITEPDQVLPRLAARMHVRMQTQLAQQLAAVLPGIIQGQIEQSTKVQGLETQFFGQYPALNKPEYRRTVHESLAMIRQVNPQATREDVMRDGAALAAVRLRTKIGPSAQQQPPVAALPQNMPLSGNAPPRQQAPFTPAQSGGGTEPVVPTDPNQDSIFAILANDTDW